MEIEELLKLQRRPKCAFGCREGERERITAKRIEMSKRCESESIGKPSNSEMFFSFYKDFNYLMWLLCGYIVFVFFIHCRCLSHHSDRMSL